jgi:glycosyltransferase involved in cell wall biosynthesis
MNILLLEPYFTGSHKSWAEGYAKYSKHTVEILSLSGNFWKWRMHGGAVTLAKKFLETDFKPDLLLVSDMLDLTTFLSLTRNQTASVPAAVYFHENQLSYPWSPQDRDLVHKRDKHYGFINYTTALAADAVFFNSRYHLESFFAELQRFLKHFPDHQELENIEKIKAKSRVLPIGLDLSYFDQFRTQIENPKSEIRNRKPLILWNHRWEYDKNPGEFFKALFILAEKGLDFEVAILGECFSQRPDEFVVAQERLADRIVQFGYVKDFAEYAQWLWRADILPITSYQDFFGASVVEALYCGCFPILPRRLAYPELIPTELHTHYFYNDFEDLLKRLQDAITNIDSVRKKNLSWVAKKFSWTTWAPIYDELFQKANY